MNKFSIEIKWGIIFIVSLLLWMVGERAVGLHDEYIAKHAIYTNLFFFVAVAVYVLALRDKRKNYYDGTMTWQQGFVSGLIITVVVALLSAPAQYVISEFITPDYFKNITAYAVENKVMTQADAESYFSLENYIVQSVVSALAAGLLTSAIVALIMRKRESSIT
ncbi:hypothetical protein GCM10009117_04130 [Gangjinia marincola]|uniref:DUF4199 domain-containing protein n=1 Tax=Gangjinia marincola TaxID=578463 RepID=A0ABN1MEV5_9FLAO